MGVILFESSGTGAMAVGPGTSFSWTHKSSGGPNTVVIVAAFIQLDPTYPSYESTTHTVTYGGVSMTSLGWKYINNQQNAGWNELFFLFNPPAGSQTVTVTTTSTATAYNSGVSCSYQNVASLGSAVTAFGNGTSETLTVTGGLADSVAVATFGNYYTLATSTTGLRKSSGWNGAPIDVADSILNNGSSTFTSIPPAQRTWSAVGVALQPVPPAKFFSMM